MYTTHKRSERVAQLLQRELGQLLVEEVQDPRIGFTTVTEVRLTNDLREAWAYVSILGDACVRRHTLEQLRQALGYFKRELGRRLALRYMPELHFEHDDSLDRVQRLEAVFKAVAQGEPAPPASQASVGDVKALPQADLSRMPAVGRPPSPKRGFPRRPSKKKRF